MSKICCIAGCGKVSKKESRMCGMHCGRLYRYGRLELIRRENGKGNIGKNGYVDLCIDNRRVYEHVLVAEKALGMRLPRGVVVHHVNEIKTDNTPTNLVVCQNDAYHKLLHRRAAAYDACGDANYVKCPICGIYDAPENMKRQNTHTECLNLYARRRYAKKIGAKNV